MRGDRDGLESRKTDTLCIHCGFHTCELKIYEVKKETRKKTRLFECSFARIIKFEHGRVTRVGEKSDGFPVSIFLRTKCVVYASL